MRAGRWGAAIAVVTAAFVVFACDSFGTNAGDEPATSDGGSSGTSSSSGVVEAGAPADGGDAPDGGGGDAGECFDFRGSNTNGFTTQGNGAPTADGYRVVVDSKTTPSFVRKTFHRQGGITTSRVGFDMTLEDPKPFAGEEYADALTLYYGLPANFGVAPETALTQFDLVAGGGVDVNMWNTAGGGGYTYVFLKNNQLPFGTDFVWIDTHWLDPGQHRVSSAGAAVPIDASIATSSKEDLTVEFGGRQGDPGAPPKLTILLRRLCVEIH